jgi:hypothetical protein
MNTIIALVSGALLLMGGVSFADGAPAPEGARAYIVSPQDGAVVPPTFTVVFGLAGMGVAPAGTDKANTGHHHLLIDARELPAAGTPMGSDVQHFGGGQTQTELTLEPGQHTLQLVLGDLNHVPHQPPVVSEVVTVTVMAVQ